MKKVFFLLFAIFCIPISVKADRMYNVDMDIDILKDGTANITEIWDVEATSGSEWYKTMYELEGSELSNFVVYMDGEELEYNSSWDTTASLSDKAGYYGINYSSDGMELCFGKSDMDRHKFTLKYTLSNYIFNTDDSQVLYWTLMPKITVDSFSATISSYYTIPHTLDVWGYGYKGSAYVKYGKIRIYDEEGLNNDYVVLLAKFPLGTFDTDFRLNKYNIFEDVYNDSNVGSFEYNYDTENYVDTYDFRDFERDLLDWLFLFPIPQLAAICYAINQVKSSRYGYIDNKKINEQNTPFFRDIPCNKDIYYANSLIKLNDFGYKKSNMLGAIILKWIKENKISFINEKKGVFRKETSSICLTMNSSFESYYEKKLFDMMYEASKDGILQTEEFENWCKNNYSKFLGLFENIEGDKIRDLRLGEHIFKRENIMQCKVKNVMDDMIYEDSKKLYGLKLYLEEFSRIDTKEVMEVKLWDEYLIFAYLFGIADKVSKQLKDMYPDILEKNMTDNIMLFDYDVIVFVNDISARSIGVASRKREASENYSSGGGGRSRGGGGGGSRGGGSRGSAGGR